MYLLDITQEEVQAIKELSTYLSDQGFREREELKRLSNIECTCGNGHGEPFICEKHLAAQRLQEAKTLYAALRPLAMKIISCREDSKTESNGLSSRWLI